MCVCVCVCICIYIYVYGIYMHTHICVCMYMYMCIFVCVCVCLCMCECVCVRACIIHLMRRKRKVAHSRLHPLLRQPLPPRHHDIACPHTGLDTNVPQRADLSYLAARLLNRHDRRDEAVASPARLTPRLRCVSARGLGRDEQLGTLQSLQWRGVRGCREG